MRTVSYPPDLNEYEKISYRIFPQKKGKIVRFKRLIPVFLATKIRYMIIQYGTEPVVIGMKP